MMVTAAFAKEIRLKTESEVRNVAVDMSGLLDDGESLTGTPTVTEVGSSDLTITNEAVSTGELTINGETVSAGEAAQFQVSGGKADTNYTLRVRVNTDASPAQTIQTSLRLKVVSD